MDKVKLELKDNTKKVLVIATSTIECGVDISFDVGWREKIGALNIFQFGGRINRGSVSKDAKVFIFEFDESICGKNKIFTKNPSNTISIRVFNNNSLNKLSAEFCTDIVKQELNILKSNDGSKFISMDDKRQFDSLKNSFNIIDSVTAVVIVDKDLIKRIKSNEKVGFNEIVRKSIQMWFTKIEKIQDLVDLNLITGFGDKNYYIWEDDYDNETGIGKVMRNL